MKLWREKGLSEVGRKKRKVERSITKMWNKKRNQTERCRVSPQIRR